MLCCFWAALLNFLKNLCKAVSTPPPKRIGCRLHDLAKIWAELKNWDNSPMVWRRTWQFIQYQLWILVHIMLLNKFQALYVADAAQNFGRWCQALEDRYLFLIKINFEEILCVCHTPISGLLFFLCHFPSTWNSCSSALPSLLIWSEPC